MLLLIAATAWLGMLAFTGEEAQRAILVSAVVAFTVQLLTFVLANILMPADMLIGWGAGMLVRLATLVMHGFVGARLLGLQMDASLISLAAFFFVTTLVEPLFFPRPAPTIRTQ